MERESVCQFARSANLGVRVRRTGTPLLMKLFAASALGMFLSACGIVSRTDGTPSHATTSSRAWLGDGVIMVSRPVPGALAVDRSRAQPALGFAPLPSALVSNPYWVRINSKQALLSVMQGEQVVDSVHGIGGAALPHGTFHVMHKQRNPLWYASTDYFANRHLSVPPESDRARYRRGALGEFALFLDSETAIHSGKVWSQEVGGMALPEKELSRIYYTLPLGAVVVVE